MILVKNNVLPSANESNPKILILLRWHLTTPLYLVVGGCPHKYFKPNKLFCQPFL